MSQRLASWNLEAKSRVTNSSSSSSKTLLLAAQEDHESRLGYDRVAEPLFHRTSSGTLESVVNQASTARAMSDPVNADQQVPPYCLGHLFESYASPLTPGDLVPNCNDVYDDNNNNNYSNNNDIILKQMGSSSRNMGNYCTTRVISETHMGNASFCCTMSQRETAGDDDCRNKRGIEMSSSVPTRKGKAAEAHSQSERKRRDKINQKIRTLQKMIPNSTKTDKASILDEVIEHVGQLQGQVHAMGSKLRSNNVLLQLAIDQQLQLQKHLMAMMEFTRPNDMETTSQHHLQMSADEILSAVTARLQS